MARKNHKPASLPANSEPATQPTPDEQSGSAGRATPAHATTQQKDTGQGRYGQSGGGGSEKTQTQGQADYHDSDKRGDARTKQKSNEGSGRASADETTKDIPKTG